MLKSKLRKTYLARQKSLSKDERARLARQISERFFDYFDLSRVSYLHIFLAIARHNEIETSIIVKRLWQDYPRVKTCVPCVDEANDVLETVEYTPESAIKVNAWGIPEVVRGKTVAATKIDVVVAPLLCFDRRGYRVGYGKGFYDRFLQNCRPDCRKIGLSFFPPVEKIADVHDADVKLDFCVTPEEIFDLKT
jgi:5-formyltetrahydrofolate cyclo-ligase